MEQKNLIGERIRSIREVRNLGIEALAEQSGIGVDILEKIEEGTEIPVISMLVKISRGLGVRPGTLLDDHEELGPVVCRAADIASSTDACRNAKGKSYMHHYSLSRAKAGRHMESFLGDILPGAYDASLASTHEGEEFIYVLEGSVTIEYGKQKFLLEKGDSIYYDSIVAHYVYAASNTPAKLLAVIFVPF
ncbi:MAG: helix-turn-helix domain-containing protein [Bacteroidales bacterium]